MSKETKTYHIDGCDYSFDFSAFKHLFNTYKTREKITITEAENRLSKLLDLSTDAIHNWRFGNNAPSSTELIKDIAEALGISDYKILLIKKTGEDKMGTNDRILDSLKRIYDAAILYLDEYDCTFGYAMYWQDLKDKGYSDDHITNEIYSMASDNLHQVEIVLQQEYIILHKLDIYGKLENYIYSDLCSLWDMKLEKYCDYDAFDDLEEFRKKPNPNEESQKAINKLNEIMSEYF